jgi:hypothetical protein
VGGIGYGGRRAAHAVIRDIDDAATVPAPIERVDGAAVHRTHISHDIEYAGAAPASTPGLFD